MTRVYIAGLITGLPDLNRPAFTAAQRALERAGHHPVNPHRTYGQPPGSMPWEWYMRRALALLLTCDGVALLDGWQESRGAGVERELAATLGMRVAPLDWWVGPCAS